MAHALTTRNRRCVAGIFLGALCLVFVLSAAAAPKAFTVVIVGGGLAGLTTAYELEKRGINAHIIEAQPTLGGRVATARYPGGLQAEYGLQEFWSANPALTLARELRLPLEYDAGEPFSSVVIDGKLIPFVQSSAAEYFASFLTDGEQTALKRWLETTSHTRKRALSQGLVDSSIQALQDRSFADWIAAEKLPRKVSEFLRLTIECELATAWDRFSALSGILEFGIFLDGGQPSFHVRGGNRLLIDKLAAAVRGPKTLSARVLRVVREQRPDASVAAQVFYESNGRIDTVAADAVVLAVPFTHVHAISLTPALSTLKRQAIETLGYGQYVVAHLLVDRDAGKLFQIRDESPLPVLTDGALGVVYGARGEGNAAAKEDVFSLLIHGQAARRLHMRPRDEAATEILSELAKLWPAIGRYVRGSYFYSYHPAAVAVWPPGRSPLDAGSRSMFEPEFGLYFAGDWLLSAHSDGAVTSGLRAAERIAKDFAR